MKDTNIFTREDVLRTNATMMKSGPSNVRIANANSASKFVITKMPRIESFKILKATRARKLMIKRTPQEINAAYSKARKLIDCG